MPGQDVRQLLLQVDASVALAQRNVGQLARQIETDSARMDRSLARVDGATGRLGTAMGGLRNVLGTLGVALSAASLINYGRGALEMAANLSETSRSIGVTVEQLQVLRRAALENGASVEGMERAMSILNRTLGQARAGVPAAVQAFRALRIDPEQFTNAGQVLPRVMDSIQRLATQSEQAAAAQRLMGRGAAEMIPLLVQGSSALERWTQQARASGLVTQEQARRADEAMDALGRLAVTLRTNLAGALADVIPYIESVARGLSALGNIATATIGRLERLGNINIPVPGGGQFNIGERLAGAGMRALNPFAALGAIVGDVQRLTGNAPPEPSHFALSAPGARDTGDLDLDLSPPGSRTRQRTATQAFHDFERALAARGLHRNRGRTGIRTYQDQADIYRQLGPGNAAPPGTSDHEFARALDLPMNTDWSAVQAAAREAGITGLRRLRHNGHTHASWSGHGRPGEGGEAGGEERMTQDEERFREQYARAQQELLRARMETVTAAEAQAAFEETQVRMEQARLAAGIEADFNEGRIDEARALTLTLVNAQIADQRVANIRERERRRIEQEALDLRLAGFSDQREILQGQAQLAETSQTRLGIELRLIDLAEQEERARLAAVLAWNSTASTAERQAALIAYQSLPTRSENQREASRRDNEGPRDRYLRELRTRVGDVGTQLEELDVRAMRALEDATLDAIKATLGLHGALGDIVGDLIRIGLQRQVILPLADMLFGGGNGGGGGGGLFGSLLGLLGGGSQFIGRNGAISAPAGVVNAPWYVGLPFGGPRAGGGDVFPGHAYLVGEKRAEMFVPKVAGTIIPRVPQVRIPRAANANAPPVTNNYYLQGNLMTPEFWARINAGDLVASASGSAGALKTAGRRASRQIPVGF